MIIVRGNDGRYTASQRGHRGQLLVGDGSTRAKASERCLDLILSDKGDEYAMEQSMSHLAETQPYGVRK